MFSSDNDANLLGLVPVIMKNDSLPLFKVTAVNSHLFYFFFFNFFFFLVSTALLGKYLRDFYQDHQIF